jgi:hypothetical protein
MKTIIRFYDLSAILIENMPRRSLAVRLAIKFFDERMETKLQPLSTKLKNENVTSCRCSFLDVGPMNKMLEETGKGNLFGPILKYIHCEFCQNREQYKILPEKDFKYYEIYNASEGFFCHSGFKLFQ